mgnify:FL=1
MYLSNIHIQDYRILKDINLHFQPPTGKESANKGNVVNVIAGVNGCGKTTLLEAIFEALSNPLSVAIANDKVTLELSYALKVNHSTRGDYWNNTVCALNNKIRIFQIMI